MRKVLYALLLGIWGIASGPSFLAAQTGPKPAGYTSIGESSMDPLMLLLLDSYRLQNPAFKLDVQSPGSTQGIQALIDGKTDIAPSSRLWTNDEIATFTARYGNPPNKITVALDALVMIVHKNNPIKELKIEQLDAIWSVTRNQAWPKDIVTWGEAGVKDSAWADRPINLYGRTGGSGIRDFFVEVIELGGKAKLNIRRGTDMSFVVESIISDQMGHGYGSLGEVCEGTRTVAVVPKGGKAGIEPNYKNVADGSYPLGHPLFIYFNNSISKPLDPVLGGERGFLRFILSSEGQRQVQLNGLVPLPASLIQLNLRNLNR